MMNPVNNLYKTKLKALKNLNIHQTKHITMTTSYKEYSYSCVIQTDIRFIKNENFNYWNDIQTIKNNLEKTFNEIKEDCEITLAYVDNIEDIGRHPMDAFIVHIFSLIKEDGKIYKNDYKTSEETEYDVELAYLMEYADDESAYLMEYALL
jgi:hypothetical protein